MEILGGSDVRGRSGGRRRPVPSGPVPRTCVDLLADARSALGRAMRADGPADRFATAHLAALRAAAAVLAARARPRRTASRSAWDLLTRVAPEYEEWSLFFASSARVRQAIEAGITSRVSDRAADDLVRQSAQFVELVERDLSAGGR